MSSADTTAEATGEEVEATEPDELREGLLAELTEALGDALVTSELIPGRDLFLRVGRDDWVRSIEAAKALGYRFFDFLSAIDWLPSPYGRYEDSILDDGLPTETGEPEPGYTGGETRFQLIARVYDVDRKIGVHFRSDLPDDDLRVDTLVGVFPGANWHEREAHEMFGISFVGHPYPANLYLPSGFEGHPLRKDFPLVARIVKPWPGLVDVEPMPDEGDDGDSDSEEASTDD